MNFFEIKENVKNLFSTAEKKDEIVELKKKTANQWGVEKAGLAKGDVASFLPSLQAMKTQCEDEQQKDVAFQQVERNKIENEIISLDGDIKNIEVQKKSCEDSLTFEEQKIEDCKKEIGDLKINPEKILGDGTKPSRASFVIGTVIIFCMTLYLVLFYSSASYSAFFRIFESDTNIKDALFDSHAFIHAWNDSISELLLICTIPFVFLGLGFLIYKFNLTKDLGRYIKVFMLFVVTFMYDTILAYSITKKIYDVMKDGSWNPENIPDYSVSLAIQDSAFWLTIFSGFVVYVIWGLVFDFVMEEYYKFDRLTVRIDELEEKIKGYKQQCLVLRDKLLKLQLEKNGLDSKKKNRENALNYLTIINHDIVSMELHNFTVGWLNYMAAAGMPKNTQEQVSIQSKEFIEQYKKQ